MSTLEEGMRLRHLLFGLVRYAWTYNDALAGRNIYVVKQRLNLFPRPDWGESGPAPLTDFALAHGLVREATRAKSFELGALAGDADAAPAACLRQAVPAMRLPPALVLRD
jgi:hypothetical protein